MAGVNVSIHMDSFIKQIHVYYYDAETNVRTMAVVRNGDEPLFVQQNTNIEVVTILFNDGGEAPVTCKGSVDTWIILDEYGNWNDPILSVDTYSKSFIFTSANYVPPSGDGCVWIDGNWYQPYIFNGSKWVPTIPCIFNGSKWVEISGR